jgi:hypothetical protein
MDIFHLVPYYTAVSVIASCRIATELGDPSAAQEAVSEGRLAMEKGSIPKDELEYSMAAYRIKPDRLEYMRGGPDSVMWDRWEWLRDHTANDGTMYWAEPKHLVPH